MVGKITAAKDLKKTFLTAAGLETHPFAFWKLRLLKLVLTSLKIFQGFKISILWRISGRLELVVC